MVKKLEERTNVVLNRCDFETATWFGSYWTETFLKRWLEQQSIPFQDLYGDWATKENFKVYCDNSLLMVSGVGHGNTNVFTGQDYDVLLDARSQSDLKDMAEVVISALSCEFGASMQKWIDAGCNVFHGYDKTYYFMAGSGQRSDSTASLFGDAHFIFDKTWLSGWKNGRNDWKAAHEASYNRYTQNAQRTWGSAQYYLLWNRDNMVSGVGQGVPPEPEPPPEPEVWNCPYCDFTGDRFSLAIHIQDVHGPDLAYPCFLNATIRRWIGCGLR